MLEFWLNLDEAFTVGGVMQRSSTAHNLIQQHGLVGDTGDMEIGDIQIIVEGDTESLEALRVDLERHGYNVEEV
jgi:hypothetical protein